ncbi:hypothetical protein GCM10010214_58960 [Streptomyces abikoensis]|nr:hypothetical protein GCM10010214_58960 [Streptomyces abikoensis]
MRRSLADRLTGLEMRYAYTHFTSDVMLDLAEEQGAVYAGRPYWGSGQGEDPGMRKLQP